MNEITAQRPHERQPTTQWQQCVVCQTDSSSKGPLVLQPRLDSYQRLLQAVEERASLNDGVYVEINRRLDDGNAETLSVQKAVWHRMCYSNATNKDQIQHALSTGTYSGKKRGHERTSSQMEEAPTEDSTPFTRSATAPLDRDLCFFCQTNDDRPMYSVRSANSGKSLRDASCGTFPRS